MKPVTDDLLVVEFGTSQSPDSAEDMTLEESEAEADSDAEPQPPGPAALPGVVIGTVMGWDQTGYPLVDFPSNSSDRFLTARTLVPLDKGAVGRDVALVFVEGDHRWPLVIGLIRPPEGVSQAESRQHVVAEADGDRLVFTAEKEIVLRCGQASITLTRAGKVLIRGAYLLSRSSGVNRIKGGSVQIN